MGYLEKLYFNFKTYVNVFGNLFGKLCFVNHLLTKELSI